MLALTRRTFVSTATLGIATAAIRPALAGPEHQEVVDKAKATVDNFHLDTDYPEFKGILQRSKGVLVFPSLVKAGFIFGGEGGSGVLVAHGSTGWSYPAFYTMGSGSFGLQIGVQDAEVILALMTDKGLEQVMKSEMKLGADASVAAGKKGTGVEAATTTNFGADILSYAKAKGAYAGATFEGSVISSRDEWNAAYYGQKVLVEDIVRHQKVKNPGADALRTALAKT